MLTPYWPPPSSDLGLVLTLASNFQPHWSGAVRRGVEIFRRAVAGVEFVNLRTARVGVPGIRVDLFDAGRVPQIHLQPSAVSAGIEKEIFRGVVAVLRQLAVVKFFQTAAVTVGRAVHNGKLRRGRGVIRSRGRNCLEVKFGRGRVVAIEINGDFRGGLQGEAGQQETRSEEHTSELQS